MGCGCDCAMERRGDVEQVEKRVRERLVAEVVRVMGVCEAEVGVVEVVRADVVQVAVVHVDVVRVDGDQVDAG